MRVVEDIQARWGNSVTTGTAGFTAVPSILIRSQCILGLSTTELVVLLNLITHWWRADELPYVRPTTIANRMDVDRRTVERALQSLEAKNLVHRLPSERRPNAPAIRRFDLSGLVGKLEKIAGRSQTNSSKESE